MRITSILQPSKPFNDGLSDIDMRGLNRIVILSGANGSGKSRLLQRVQHGGNPSNQGNFWGQDFELDISDSSLSPVFFVPKNLTLTDPEQITEGSITQFAIQATHPGMDQIANSMVSYIKSIQNEWWDINHQWNDEVSAIRDVKNSNYKSLCEIISTVLGESLKRVGGKPVLFDKPIAQALLSEGQKLLLQWCTALHAQGSKLSELILLMDEPENHIHPEAMISTIDRIIEANNKGQIWIATHSVPLIAAIYKKYAADVSLYFMDNGAISYASEKPEKVLNSLMGGEQNIEALREFIDLPEIFATNRFAAQCLLPPDVNSASPKIDSQVQIIDEDVSETLTKIKMLDFGCGKGRILESLFAIYGPDLQDKLDYIGWDDSKENREQCQQVIGKTYQDITNRWFDDRQLLTENHPQQSFDRIVLCNVLHEINPKDWCSLFDDTSIINQNLADSGKLLIIEDYLMPKGEYAHPFGFIVLDTESLRALFLSETFEVKSKQNGRVRGHFIPKKLIANVTQHTIKAALKLAQRNAKENIKELRKPNNNHDFKSGREHGFWVQQYANTTLALEP
jgi:predicted ATPase/SAM-dependent methyltransferase